jgi:leucyl-tRNA---protein transferase
MFQTVEEHPCAYLPDLAATTLYRFDERCPASFYQAMLERGWRRFGAHFFRPACVGCRECRSLRVDVAAFAPNRSMSRTWKKNRDLSITLQPVSLADEHLELFDRYHADMNVRRHWHKEPSSASSYYFGFVQGRNEYGHELIFRHGERLVAVALVDLLPRALSAVYCYYDPELRERGLGVFAVLTEIELARRRGIGHAYLGFCVEGNVSVRYKANYRPHEILEGRPADHETPLWQPGHSSGAISGHSSSVG